MEDIVFKLVLTAIIVALVDIVVIKNFEYDDLGFVVAVAVVYSFLASLAAAVFGCIYLIWV